MENRIKLTELGYKACFCMIEDCGCYLRLSDTIIPDMRAHNMIIFKDGTPPEEVRDIVDRELKNRELSGNDYLKVMSFEPLSEDLIKRGVYDVNDFYEILTDDYHQIKQRHDVEILLADNERIMNDGKSVDIEANQQAMTEAFAIRRIERKSVAYNDTQNTLDFFVAYLNGTPVGNCEMYVKDDTCKLEDFDILPRYQKMRIGSHFLRFLLERLNEKKIQHAYVVTDHFDTAKEMYIKCGFKYVGQSFELLINLC